MIPKSEDNDEDIWKADVKTQNKFVGATQTVFGDGVS
jgi:hypothetical protein